MNELIAPEPLNIEIVQISRPELTKEFHLFGWRHAVLGTCSCDSDKIAQNSAIRRERTQLLCLFAFEINFIRAESTSFALPALFSKKESRLILSWQRSSAEWNAIHSRSWHSAGIHYFTRCVCASLRHNCFLSRVRAFDCHAITIRKSLLFSVHVKRFFL